MTVRRLRVGKRETDMNAKAAKERHDARNPHVRVGDGEVASVASLRRGSLFYRKMKIMKAALSLATTCGAFLVSAGVAEMSSFMSSLGGIDFDQSFSLADKRDEAIRRGDWVTAIEAGRGLVNSPGETDFNMASHRLCQSLLYWNNGDKASAKSMLESTISLLRYSSQLGGGCEARAVQLLAKMREDDLPSKFSAKDMIEGGGVLDFVMEMPYAQAMGKFNALKVHYNRLMQQMDSEIRTLDTQAQINAGQARAYARQQYLKVTGDTFTPSNPPRSGTKARDSWDSCKRIYDIFGK